MTVAPAGRDDMTVADLLTPQGFEPALSRFAAAYPQSDRRALLSFWSQFYFGALLPPAASAALLFGRILPLAANEVAVSLDERGLPAIFHLRGDGHDTDAADPFARIAPLLDGHLASVIDGLARFGLPPRLLWANAACLLDWVIGRFPEPGQARTLLEEPSLPDGRANPLFAAFRRDPGFGPRRRRFCCLRCRLPGVAACGSCPIKGVIA